ncbi:uncharacterized protein LOC128226882 [Mya arenaria]|uniref:uncharacterized protein LOC128226882 n=1 Tax=Mya arenaria TaxID=6604 RepID=UPI0022DF9DCC|nr:uncharacterized protein LOC128226882 [Mya arenaria]
MENDNFQNITNPRDGYDLPVYGIYNNTFYGIHIPALICIVTSFTCAIIAIVLSFMNKSRRTFFTAWSKSDRFIVYLAVCDGLFNTAHFTDHMHVVIVRNHVYPRQLCEFYGFTLAEFITAQNLMVNVIAVNAFMLMYFDRNINFGKYDWRLLTWTFGAPFVGASIAGALGQLGPNGAFCHFDAVKGKIAGLFFTTVTILIILLMNSILFALILRKIRALAHATRHSHSSLSSSMRTSVRAAQSMSLFVAAFFIQWWAMALYGTWNIFTDDVPQPLFHLVTIFVNLGGILNLCVYLIIRRRLIGRWSSKRSNTTIKSTNAATPKSTESKRESRI